MLGRSAGLFLTLPMFFAAANAGEQSVLFDEGRGYRYCASMCLQLAMQAMRHEDRGHVDPAQSVTAMCTETCQPQAEREGLTGDDRLSIMAETLDGLQKPPSWGIPGAE